MTSGIWIGLLVLNKFLVYLGVSAAFSIICVYLYIPAASLENVDKVAMRWRHTICKVAMVLVIIGFIANVVDFFVQTGNFAENGVKGMFEPIILNMMWASSVGTLTMTRAIAFGLSFALLTLILIRPLFLTSRLNQWIFGTLTLLVIIGLSTSFTLSGHTNALVFGSVSLITFHVAMSFAWLGALIPLVRATYIFEGETLHFVMERFGQFAGWGVAILVIAAVSMLIQFVPTLESLYTSRYGQVFILKIALVLLLLLFAVTHKFVLVPRILSREDGAVALRRSIMVETFVGFLILFVTSVVTTVMGPPLLESQLI